MRLMCLSVYHEIQAESLTSAMSDIGYLCDLQKEHPLPNGKQFIRLDFTASN